jgi:hypothetical protein
MTGTELILANPPSVAMEELLIQPNCFVCNLLHIQWHAKLVPLATQYIAKASKQLIAK